MPSLLSYATAAMLGLAAPAIAAPVTRYPLPALAGGKPARILQGVKLAPGTHLLYLSGQLASPVDPKAAVGPATTMADLGDTRTQTLSTLAKIKTILASHGYAMSDVVKMTAFVVADPKLGKMDFDGLNAGFEQYFNSPENPNTVARSAVQVAALAGPAFLVEIEVIAAK